MNDLITRKENAIYSPVGLTPDMFSRWVSFLDVKPKTVETYTKSIRRFLTYMQERGISRPTREDIILYRDMLRENYKPTTVQSYMAAVKLFFQWTAQEGIYPNVAERVKGAKLDTAHKKDYLTSKQAGKLLSSIDRSTVSGLRDYAMIALMVTGGLRTIEVARANIEDMRTAGDSPALFIQGKGRDEKTEYVRLPERVDDAIRAYLKARGAAGKNDPLFASESNRNDSGRLTTRSVSRIVKARMIAAGFNSDRLTAHSLRHTAATLMLLNGKTAEETQQILRHASINTTMIYSHAVERAKNDGEDVVAKAVFG